MSGAVEALNRTPLHAAPPCGKTPCGKTPYGHIVLLMPGLERTGHAHGHALGHGPRGLGGAPPRCHRAPLHSCTASHIMCVYPCHGSCACILVMVRVCMCMQSMCMQNVCVSKASCEHASVFVFVCVRACSCACVCVCVCVCARACVHLILVESKRIQKIDLHDTPFALRRYGTCIGHIWDIYDELSSMAVGQR